MKWKKKYPFANGKMFDIWYGNVLAIELPLLMFISYFLSKIRDKHCQIAGLPDNAQMAKPFPHEKTPFQ